MEYSETTEIRDVRNLLSSAYIINELRGFNESGTLSHVEVDRLVECHIVEERAGIW